MAKKNTGSITVNMEALTMFAEDQLGKGWYTTNITYQDIVPGVGTLWKVNFAHPSGKIANLLIEQSLIDRYNVAFAMETTRLNMLLESDRIKLEYSDEELNERLFEERE